MNKAEIYTIDGIAFDEKNIQKPPKSEKVYLAINFNKSKERYF